MAGSVIGGFGFIYSMLWVSYLLVVAISVNYNISHLKKCCYFNYSANDNVVTKLYYAGMGVKYVLLDKLAICNEKVLLCVNYCYD